jgi:hypothetical protein
MQAVANDVRGGVVPKSDHFIAEENPEYRTAQLFTYFAKENNSRSPHSEEARP